MPSCHKASARISIAFSVHSFGPSSTIKYVPCAVTKATGEVGAAVDVEAASEWLARIVYSFSTVNEALTFDMSNPETVRRYVEKFAVNGLR